MKIKLETTNHKTTQDEQWQKFLDELVEFQEAIEDYEVDSCNCDYVRVSEELIRNVVDEGIDVCKSLSKWGNIKHEYCLENISYNPSYYFAMFEDLLGTFQENKSELSPIVCISSLLCYLIKFCEENNLDFEVELKKNDEKNRVRGYCD